MDLRRLRAGELLAGITGLVLLVALFVPWYSDEVGTRTGWESLGALDVVLALTALFGALAVVLVLIRVLNMPDWATGREWGLWVALAATLGVTAGGLLAM